MNDTQRTFPAHAGRTPGVLVAALTAFVSGISVFVNSYGVHAFASPTTYTTAKNIVAAIVLAAVVGFARLRHAPGTLPPHPWPTRGVSGRRSPTSA
jgi:hypothetical protein